MTKRPPILPLGTPDRPQRPPRIVPAGVNADLRARIWPAIVAASVLIWGALAAGAWSLWQ